ncbi:hypothetical protein RHOSPDRAFT_25705 [Rhodotorula sp. JG-1b]|nr:hypothetical protein RHOSPDRAFT_25705 [Rhodotorula sp. JG-1b]
MGLVDYGSDSDSDSPPSAAPAPAPVPPTRAKRRILLDLPAPSAPTAQAAGQSSAKRLKSDTAAAGEPAPLTGLAAMLPKPKNSSSAPSAPVAPPKAAEGPSRLQVLLAGADKAPKGNEAMLLPPAVAAAAKRKQEQAPPAPAADFFGISSVASSSSSTGPAPSTSSSKQPSLSFSAAPSISSAPAPKPQPSSSSTAKPKEADDPYPGFTQLPSGEWVAKDQKTYEMWMAWQQAQQAQQQELAAEGLDEKDLKARGGLVDVKPPPPPPATGANAAVPGGRAEGYLPATQLKGIPSQLSGSAKRKHQLSSLLAAAHDNRAELEDRIAQARQNRRSGANKYGFVPGLGEWTARSMAQ